MYHQARRDSAGGAPPVFRRPRGIAGLGRADRGRPARAGQYSIARLAGGPRNGVLTAVEDFVAGESGQGWQAIIVPIAYGLAVLYRPR